MNSQRIAQLRISPLHIQQALFLLLAVLVTLIAIQQFQHWTQADDVALVKYPISHDTSHRAVNAAVVSGSAHAVRPVEGLVSVSEMAPQQKWVF
jgi:hypothetical protein